MTRPERFGTILRFTRRPKDIDPAGTRVGWRNVVVSVVVYVSAIGLLVLLLSSPGEPVVQVGALASVLGFYAEVRWGYRRPTTRR